MRLSFLVLLLSLFSSTAFADEIRVGIMANTPDGRYHVQTYNYTNAWGRREVRLESNVVHAIQGYGRDTDDDGKVDTWFMIDRDEGLKVHYLPSSQYWGHDVIEHQLFRRYRSSGMASFAAAYGSIFGTVMISIAHAYESEKNLWREMVDLEEFSIRLQRARAQHAVNEHQWNSAVDLLMKGQDEMIKRFDRAMHEQYWTLAGADVALWMTGGILVKGAMKTLAFLGRPMANLPVMAGVKDAYKIIGDKFLSRYRREMARWRVMKGIPARVIATNVFKQKFPVHMRGLMAKNHILRKSLPSIVRLGRGIKQATLGWQYIAFMTGLQFSTEAFANYDEVADPNPTEFAKNVLTHPDIVQNVAYMSSDAYLMTVANHTIRRPRAKFAACGFIALTNSGITNLVIKGETDYKRVALDTGWEAVVGNAQIQLDLRALSHFEQVAARNNNPRLKLLGWAVVLVDQVVGFATYSQATTMIEGEPKQVMLVPVHAVN